MACTQMELLNLGSLDVAGYLSGSLQSPRENMEVGAGTTGNCYKTCGQCRPLEEFLETFRHSLSWHAGTLGSRRSSPGWRRIPRSARGFDVHHRILTQTLFAVSYEPCACAAPGCTGRASSAARSLERRRRSRMHMRGDAE